MKSGTKCDTRDLDQVVDAIVSGYRNDTIKAKLDALEARKAEIEAEISGLGAEEPIRLHPGLSEDYRRKVANLTAALNDDSTRSEATELLRSLLQEVRLIPEGNGHAIELVGELAAIMALGDAKDQKARSMATGIQRTMVAGGRNSRSLRNEGKNAKTSATVSAEVSQLSLVAGAGNQRYLRLVERNIPRLAA